MSEPLSLLDAAKAVADYLARFCETGSSIEKLGNELRAAIEREELAIANADLSPHSEELGYVPAAVRDKQAAALSMERELAEALRPLTKSLFSSADVYAARALLARFDAKGAK